MAYGTRSLKGIFNAKNPQKYKGDAKNIVYRSSWELKLMRVFDESPKVLWWASEEMKIDYYCPVGKKKRRYFPDFIVRQKEANGKESTIMIEVKPYAMTQEPEKPVTKDRRKLRSYIKQALVYENNLAKWSAAEAFCEEKGWKFVKMTEYELQIRKKTT